MKGDVLVVGCSTAGMAAAISAARTGAETILMDRSLRAFDHPANTLFEGMIRRSGMELSQGCINHTLKGMRIISPGGYSLEIPARGYFIDRDKFDRERLKAAEGLGVTFLEDEALGSRLDHGCRYVDTVEGKVRAKVVIDASGLGGVLALRAGLRPMHHPDDVAWAYEATVEHPGLGQECLFEYWVGSLAPGWKATFSPAGGDRATLGVFVRRHGRNVQPFFRKFLRTFKKYKTPSYGKIDSLRIISVSCGGDPIAALPGEMVADSLMVTGGAAGQSGLAYSTRAGEICGTVAAEAALAGDISRKALLRYDRLWKAEFGQEYRIGRASLETLRSMRDYEIDGLVRAMDHKNLLPPGPLYRKAISAGLTIASSRPSILPVLIKNLMTG